MSETVRIRALVNMPQWFDTDGQRFLRGHEGELAVGDGEGEVAQSELEGRLELTHVARVKLSEGEPDAPAEGEEAPAEAEEAPAKKTRRVTKSA